MGLRDIFVQLAQNIKPQQRETIPNILFMYKDDQKYKNEFYVPNEQELRNFAKNSIVRRAMSLIIDGVVKLDWQIVNADKNDKKQYKRDKQVLRSILENPNIVHEYEDFCRLVLEDLLIGDCGAFEKCRCRDANHPIYLYPVNGFTIGVVQPFDFTDENAARYAQRQGTEVRYFTGKQISYLQKNMSTASPYGLGAVASAYVYIDYLLNTQEYANTVASNAMPKYGLNIKNITPDQLKAYRKYLANEVAGTNSIPVFSSDGIESTQMGAINDDALYAGWQQLLMSIIAVSFNLPPEKLSITKSNDRSTVEEKDQNVLEEAVKPYANILAKAFNRMFREAGYGHLKVEHIFAESEKAKTSRSDRVVKEFKEGILTENDARELLSYPKRESEYSDVTIFEAKAKVNKDYMALGGFGFNGVGTVKDTSEVKDSADKATG